MKFTRLFSALLALAFMAACGGVSPTGVDDECDPEVTEDCAFGGTMGSGG
jgi:hypothetical protein